MAISAYHKAYHWSVISNRLPEKINAAEGLFKAYRLQQENDSAFKYNALYYAYRDTLETVLDREKLAVINSQIAFDDTQTKLESANQTISRQRLIRNFILVCIVLVTMITLLVYNREMLKQKNKAGEIERQRKLAEAEVRQAKKQILHFTESIIEKEKLIEKLQSQNYNPDIVQTLSSYSLLTDSAWDEFRLEFAKAYPSFFSKLKLQLTQITPAEERLAALLYLQLSASQISGTLGISKESVGRSKRRLKSRLNLPSVTSLEDFLQQF
ncbi:hypothetical protein D9M68_580130 [compost metagenome]